MLASKFHMLNRVIRERPYYLIDYGSRTLLFSISYIILQIQKRLQPNLKIGLNPRILGLNAIKVEMPDAKAFVGDWIIIYRNCDILVSGKGSLTIGNYCSIGSNFRLYCKERITIGDAVLISWNVFIADYNGHSVDPDQRDKELMYSQGKFFPRFTQEKKPYQNDEFRPTYIAKPVEIGDRVWIGANVIITKGVSIGSDSVVAAGAVVTKDVPERCIVAGNPAQIVKRIE